jgi:amino acid permease
MTSEKIEYDNDMCRVETHGIEAGLMMLEREGTRRGIKSRHAQMIAIGGTIGSSTQN